MDVYISQMQDVISALTSYFENMKTHIKNNHPNRYVRLEKLDYDNIKLFEDLSKLRAAKNEVSMENVFHISHVLQLITVNLGKMYDTMQFPLEVSEDLSSTRYVKLTSMFNQITAMYRLFIKDVSSQQHTIVTTLYDSLNTKDDYRQASASFRKYPGSIQLYILYVSTLMDKSFHEKNKELQSTLVEIIEQDKSFILEEVEWSHAFLSFNLVPNGPVCKTVDALCAFIRSSGINISAANLNDLAARLHDLKIGMVTVSRPQRSNAIINPIPKHDVKKGISDAQVRTRILEFFDGKSGDWSIKVDNSNDTYIVVETLGERYRLLTPWSYKKLVIHHSQIRNMFNTHNDRPHRYNMLLSSHIMKNWNRHVYEFMKSDAPQTQLNVKAEGLQRAVIRVYRDDKSRTPLHKRVISEAVQTAFRIALDEELGTSLHDIRFYFVDDLCEQFIGECSVNAAEIQESIGREQELLLVEKVYHDSITKVLKNNKPTFNVLPQNEYILKTISEIILDVDDLHPRRDPSKSSGIIEVD